MTYRQEIDKILKEEIFIPYGIPITYKASDRIVYKTTETIDRLAAQAQKGFCTRTANKIKNKINATGEEVTPEPK